MKQSILLGIFLLVASGCVPQEAPPPAAPSYAAPGNATTYFDGTYEGNFVQQITAGSPNLQCPNYRVAPALTIRDGVAQFAALDLQFQGYVTPQGQLNMQAPTGQTFQGQIDPYYVLRGRVTGNCVYDATWQRKGGVGPKPS